MKHRAYILGVFSEPPELKSPEVLAYQACRLLGPSTDLGNQSSGHEALETVCSASTPILEESH